jgi:Fe-coproporphyrin III synthase
MLPEIIDIEFSARCNLKCGFCFGPTDDRSVPDLPTTFWMQVLDWIQAFGARGIVVSGGEPTIYPDITKLLKHAKDLGLSVVMSTHGQIRKKVLACVPFTDWIALPIDGVSEQMLAEMRGRPWGLTQAKELVSELKAQHPRLGIKLGTVATKVNLDEIPLLAEELVKSEIRIDTWKVYQYTARRQFKDRASEFTISDEAFAKLRAKVCEVAAQSPFKIVFSTNDSRRRAYLFVYPDGTVAVPNVGLEMTDHVLGNLFTEGGSVFERVSGVDFDNHSQNYGSTYSGG